MADMTTSATITPRRSTRHSTASTQVDTEGRRSRFHSPPPPPGASPSLLIPTPGRYASNASGLFSQYGEAGEQVEESSSLPPLKNPVFELDTTLDVAATLDLLNNESQQDGRIHLHRWSLRFVPIKAPLSIRIDTLDLTHWIIASGIRYKNEETSKKSLDSQSDKSEPWRSSLIYQRQSSAMFLTGSGSIYELVGSCDIDITTQKISSEFAESFLNGVPEDWIDLVVKEARKKGFVRSVKAQKRESIDQPMRVPAKGAQYKRKSRASQVDKPQSKRRKLDVESAETSGSETKRKSFSIYQESSKDPGHIAKLPRGVSRELLQLQSSKLGSLPLVRAAILEGMCTPKKVFIQEEVKESPGILKSTSTDNSSTRKAKNQFKNSVTPLRSSSRARNATSEWWKVSNSSVKKKEEHNLSLSSKVNNEEHDSPIKSFGAASDGSDSSLLEEEYKCGSSSGGEEENQSPIKGNQILKKRENLARTQKKVGTERGKKKVVLITDFLQRKRADPELIEEPAAMSSPQAIYVEETATETDCVKDSPDDRLSETTPTPTLNDRDHHTDVISVITVEPEYTLEDEVSQVEAQLVVRSPTPMEEETEPPIVNHPKTQAELVTVMSDFSDDEEGQRLFYFSD